MSDKEVVALAAAFLEEAGNFGAGDFERRPAFQALRAALRPVRPAAIPVDVARVPFVPAAFGGPSEAPLTSQDHARNVAEVEFTPDGSQVEKPLFTS